MERAEHTELQMEAGIFFFTWGGVGAAVLVSAALCWRVLETGCIAAAEDRVAAMLALGRVGATGTGGRRAVYASFFTTLVIGPDIENGEPTVPDCMKRSHEKVSFKTVIEVNVLSLFVFLYKVMEEKKGAVFGAWWQIVAYKA